MRLIRGMRNGEAYVSRPRQWEKKEMEGRRAEGKRRWNEIERGRESGREIARATAWATGKRSALSRVIASIIDRFSTAGMNISISQPVSVNCGERDFFGRRNARIGRRVSAEFVPLKKRESCPPRLPPSSFANPPSGLGDFDETRITSLYQASR